MDEFSVNNPETPEAERCSGRTARGFRRFFRLPAVRLGLLGSWIALTISLAGCPSLGTWAKNNFKVGPEYGRPPAAVEETWTDASQEPEKVVTERCSYAYWWTVFDDPILNSLVATATRQNLGLQAAGMRILEARYIREATVGNIFPQFQTFSGSYSANKMSTSSGSFGTDHYDIWQGGFDATWELDIWGRYRRAIEAADASLDSETEYYDDVLVILQGDVASNYIQFRTLDERLAYARRNVELQRETLKVIRAQLDAGAGSELDYQQGRADLANVEAAVPLLEKQQRVTHNRLCVLLGMPPGSLNEQLVGPGKVPATPKEAIVGIPADLLRRRPDIRRAERQAAAQSALIGVAEADLYPAFTISGTIGLQAREFSQLWKNDSMVGSVGPGFQWNILNYGRILNRTRAEEALFYQLVLNYQQTVLAANEEVENALIAFLREQNRLASLRDSVMATQKAYELSKFSYEHGAVDYQRLLDSQRTLVTRQDALAESRGNVATYLVSIYKALGGGWETRLGQPRGRMVRRISVVDSEDDSMSAPPTIDETTPPGPPSPEPAEAPNAAPDNDALPMPPLPGEPAATDAAGGKVRVNVLND